MIFITRHAAGLPPLPHGLVHVAERPGAIIHCTGNKHLAVGLKNLIKRWRIVHVSHTSPKRFEERDGVMVNVGGFGWKTIGYNFGVGEDEDGHRKLVHLGSAGRGVNRQLVHLGDAGQGVNRKREGVASLFAAIRDRIRHVRVCCGDWSRVSGDTPLFPVGRNSPSRVTAVFLDPPYADTAKRAADLYRKDSPSVAHAVREWAVARGDDVALGLVLALDPRIRGAARRLNTTSKTPGYPALSGRTRCASSSPTRPG